MTKLLLLAAACIAAIAVTLTPLTFGAGARRAVAIAAIQADILPVGIALLAPLAEAGDAVAQNNLGVLYIRGAGVERDPVQAARLLNAAANAGLPRAQMNLVLLRNPCDTAGGTETVRKLQEYARAGDKRAASFVADCLIWFTNPNERIEGFRRLLAMAEIATRTGDADEELKFGWLLMKNVRDLNGYGSSVEPLKREVSTAAARYLLLAVEHGRAAAYEGISKIVGDYANLLTDETVAKRVAAKNAAEWIETAAAAGHPRSRCTLGVKFATQLAEKKTRASDADRQTLADLFQTCLKERDPRQVIFKDGREQTIGHWRLFDVWKMDDEFLITSPKYENYDHDIAARDDAVYRIAKIAQGL